ncbi:class I SAM-dependent methyltransferase [Nodularia sphaerocarpa]|uniref:class I SAM-dependent methyltransferase n=1 Tax=Nodularia sphaerocarpa TaxID=137816 RepID=UPI001EFBE1FF|nr:class I SAM-dependent methyltransferase [Nodularia sphaerocarpa]MDB9374858.1 class I SAM-dependent methyltransferase [Nodularia sphaerocarpa CS-585]MDB9378878.1 class I SAM-dependent methyltransferase [Nodularia sphaerocarpa CS-585A2]ULP70479.1 putative methyltransferase YcgJ [Nodularia sphaerocarpa UHCC 0038]
MIREVNAHQESSSIAVQLAKLIMKKFETFPVSPEIEVGELQEVFNHAVFINGTDQKQKEIMLHSSESKYRSETAYSWDHYFGKDLTPDLEDKDVLDLGCFNGGRGIACFEKFKMASITGIDVAPEYIEAATQFAKVKNVNAKYVVAQGEELPFADASFDAIVTFDVMEHVQNLEKTLAECYRVLRPNGIFCLVFPGYYHPIEHHLNLVTKIPFIHYFFSGKTIVQAYYEILQERGKDAYWYSRNSPTLGAWEKGNTINGTTVAKFQNLIKKKNWQVVLRGRKPIGSIGRNVSQNKLMNLISIFLYPLASIPILQEVFLHRITYILKKPGDA